MASGERQSMSSVFDEMLKDTWRELDGLYDGPVTPAKTSIPQPSAHAASASSAASAKRSVTSEPERFLNDRYGDGWRQEIVERKRDGDEVVVLAKLRIDEKDIVKTQFGRARIAGASSDVGGTSGGVRFSVGETAGGKPSTSAEADAYVAAAIDALSKCVAML